METTFFVYLLTFANGKVYVGMSRTDKRGLFTLRYNNHARTAKRGKSSPIYNAWRKHGAPVQSILSTHETREACALAEIDAIQVHDSMNPAHGYNLMAGGQGLHAPVGSAIYELMRAKVWNDPERRRKASEALKGKPLPPDTQAAQRAWITSDEGKASTAAMTQRPEVREKMSAAMTRRLENGYREYLSEVQTNVPKTMSEAGREHQRAGVKAWLATDEGKAAQRAGIAAMHASELRKVRHAEFANSDANKAHCATMGAKARKPVKDLASGQVYESRTAAAAALGVTGPTIGYWVKQGKFEYV